METSHNLKIECPKCGKKIEESAFKADDSYYCYQCQHWWSEEELEYTRM